MVRLTAIQLTSTPNVEENLATIRRILAQLPAAEKHIVVLPECCLFFGDSDHAQLKLAQNTAAQQGLQQALAQLALEFKLTLVAGSIPVLIGENKYANRCYVFDHQGKNVGYYDKMHLFDVSVNDNSKHYCESHYTQAGSKPTTVNLPMDNIDLNIGLSICYDLRFPELYRYLQQQGAHIITVPSAFTQVTGKAHWQPLLQARAIENQCFIIAAGQQGVHANGRETWGHSMVISPWGEILACQKTGAGAASVTVNLNLINDIRAKMPVSKHNQFSVAVKKL